MTAHRPLYRSSLCFLPTAVLAIWLLPAVVLSQETGEPQQPPAPQPSSSRGRVAADACISTFCGSNFGGQQTPSGFNLVLAPGSGFTDLWDGTTKLKQLRLWEGSNAKVVLSSSGTSYLSGALAVGGTNAGGFMLSVKGGIRANSIVVSTGWSDHVFADTYSLLPLDDLASYIQEHRHLPGIPTAAEVERDGVSLGESQSQLLAKVEELTLYLIALERQNDELSARLTALEEGQSHEPRH